MGKCFILLCVLLLALSCASQAPMRSEVAVRSEVAEARVNGIPLDAALSEIAAYYIGNLGAGAKIALVGFEADALLLADYVFEEFWIRFEDSGAHIGGVFRMISA